MLLWCPLYTGHATDLEVFSGIPLVQFCLLKGGGKIRLSLSSGMSYRASAFCCCEGGSAHARFPCLSVLPLHCHVAQVGCAAEAVWLLDVLRPVKTAQVLTCTCADPLGCPCGV